MKKVVNEEVWVEWAEGQANRMRLSDEGQSSVTLMKRSVFQSEKQRTKQPDKRSDKRSDRRSDKQI